MLLIRTQSCAPGISYQIQISWKPVSLHLLSPERKGCFEFNVSTCSSPTLHLPQPYKCFPSLFLKLGRFSGFEARAKELGFQGKTLKSGKKQKKQGAVKEAPANSLPSSCSLTASANWRKKDVVSQGTAQDFPALLVELVGGWVLVEEDKLNVSQQCVPAAAKVSHVLACFSQRVASRPRKWPFPLLGMHEASGAPCPSVGPQAAETEEDPEKGYQEGYRSGAWKGWIQGQEAWIVLAWETGVWEWPQSFFSIT